MVIYILDAIQHREAALLAVWLCLGLMNMSFGLTVLFFTSTSSILISILMAVMNGITLFMTGKRSNSKLMHKPKHTMLRCLVLLRQTARNMLRWRQNTREHPEAFLSAYQKF